MRPYASAAPRALKMLDSRQALISNLILFASDFEMIEELRGVGVRRKLLSGLVSLGLEKVGVKTRWKHCHEQIERTFSKEDAELVYEELDWLRMDWNSSSAVNASVFAPEDRNERFALKLRSAMTSAEAYVRSMDKGEYPVGSRSEHWAKNRRVTAVSGLVWRAYLDSLRRAEEMRLAQPGARPWAECQQPSDDYPRHW